MPKKAAEQFRGWLKLMGAIDGLSCLFFLIGLGRLAGFFRFFRLGVFLARLFLLGFDFGLFDLFRFFSFCAFSALTSCLVKPRFSVLGLLPSSALASVGAAAAASGAG